jgi:hypothetical protein
MVYPELSYDEAIKRSKLTTLSERRSKKACGKLFSQIVIDSITIA